MMGDISVTSGQARKLPFLLHWPASQMLELTHTQHTSAPSLLSALAGPLTLSSSRIKEGLCGEMGTQLLSARKKEVRAFRMMIP